MLRDRPCPTDGSKRARRATRNLFDQTYGGFLSRRLLRHGTRGCRKSHGLRGDDCSVSRFFKIAWNDLSTPVPALDFPGLKPSDRWCLCASRWQEAFEAGQAPRVVLRATHEGALTFCSLADLKRFAVDLA
jgi:hypothetical protein